MSADQTHSSIVWGTAFAFVFLAIAGFFDHSEYLRAA